MARYRDFPHKENQAKLIELMDRYRVTIDMVADLLEKKYDTVRVYRSIAGRNINDNELERLEFKLAQKYGKH